MSPIATLTVTVLRGRGTVNGKQKAPDRRRGACNPQAKLDDDKVRWMRSVWQSVVDGRRMTVRAVAAAAGVSKSTAYDILIGNKWRHV